MSFKVAFIRSSSLLLPLLLGSLGISFSKLKAETKPNSADSGIVENIVGTGKRGFGASGQAALQTELAEPFGIVRGPDGLLYFCEFTGQVVRRIEKDGKLTTVAGTPGKVGYTGDGGPAMAATFNKPHELVFDSAGGLYVSDMSNHAIRKIDTKTGIISTVVGNGTKGFAGDGGLAKDAQCADPISITIDPAGDLWFCDIGNNRLRKIDHKTGKVDTVCGNGEKKNAKDGDPLSPHTPLNGPRTLAFDAKGTGWLVLREGNAVFTFSYKGGPLKHVAGAISKGKNPDKTKQTTEPSGNDVEVAREATLHGPKGIALTPDGQTAFLADTEGQTIRKIDAKSGKISTFLGTGKKENGPVGPATGCSLARPHGVYVDADGYLYVGDSENHLVRRIRLN